MDIQNYFLDEEELSHEVKEAVGDAPRLSEEDKHLLITFLSMTRQGNMTEEDATFSLRQIMGDDVLVAIDRVLEYQKWVMLDKLRLESFAESQFFFKKSTFPTFDSFWH